ncbi:hypothetical protein BC830DRAFT_1130070 [Chytriomyces sp. MP71]|nr:hypothetical protein BC830DRAFT_1130070 [Chytriomyces sp. MP71]
MRWQQHWTIPLTALACLTELSVASSSSYLGCYSRLLSEGLPGAINQINRISKDAVRHISMQADNGGRDLSIVRDSAIVSAKDCIPSCIKANQPFFALFPSLFLEPTSSHVDEEMDTISCLCDNGPLFAGNNADLTHGLDSECEVYCGKDAKCGGYNGTHVFFSIYTTGDDNLSQFMDPDVFKIDSFHCGKPGVACGTGHRCSGGQCFPTYHYFGCFEGDKDLAPFYEPNVTPHQSQTPSNCFEMCHQKANQNTARINHTAYFSLHPDVAMDDNGMSVCGCDDGCQIFSESVKVARVEESKCHLECGRDNSPCGGFSEDKVYYSIYSTESPKGMCFQTDLNNCGYPNNVCSSPETCVNGVCTRHIATTTIAVRSKSRGGTFTGCYAKLGEKGKGNKKKMNAHTHLMNSDAQSCFSFCRMQHSGFFTLDRDPKTGKSFCQCTNGCQIAMKDKWRKVEDAACHTECQGPSCYDSYVSVYRTQDAPGNCFLNDQSNCGTLANACDSNHECRNGICHPKYYYIGCYEGPRNMMGVTPLESHNLPFHQQDPGNCYSDCKGTENAYFAIFPNAERRKEKLSVCGCDDGCKMFHGRTELKRAEPAMCHTLCSDGSPCGGFRQDKVYYAIYGTGGQIGSCFRADPDHCGYPGNKCLKGEMCVNYHCRRPGETEMPVSVLTSKACGSSKIECGVGFACIRGICRDVGQFVSRKKVLINRKLNQLDLVSGKYAARPMLANADSQRLNQIEAVLGVSSLRGGYNGSDIYYAMYSNGEDEEDNSCVASNILDTSLTSRICPPGHMCKFGFCYPEYNFVGCFKANLDALAVVSNISSALDFRKQTAGHCHVNCYKSEWAFFAVYPDKDEFDLNKAICGCDDGCWLYDPENKIEQVDWSFCNKPCGDHWLCGGIDETSIFYAVYTTGMPKGACFETDNKNCGYLGHECKKGTKCKAGRCESAFDYQGCFRSKTEREMPFASTLPTSPIVPTARSCAAGCNGTYYFGLYPGLNGTVTCSCDDGCSLLTALENHEAEKVDDINCNRDCKDYWSCGGTSESFTYFSLYNTTENAKSYCLKDNAAHCGGLFVTCEDTMSCYNGICQANHSSIV